MYNKTMCFIYMFCRLKLPFNPNVMHASLQQISGHTEAKDIIQILLHQIDYRPWIFQAVLIYTIQK